MSRRPLLAIFGCIPAAVLLAQMVYYCSIIVGRTARAGGNGYVLCLALLLPASALAGTAALWFATLDEKRAFADRRTATIVGVGLGLGMVDALLGVLFSALWVQVLALSTVISAAVAFRGVLRAFRPAKAG